MNYKSYLIIFLVSSFFWGCNAKSQEGDNEEGKPIILATTGMIADAIHNIVKDSAEVLSLMGPGVDPHLYKATQGDLKKLQDADVIFYNGLHLEGKMSELFHKLQNQKPVYPVADGVVKSRLHMMDNDAQVYDPHIWFDVSLWREAIAYINTTLGNKYPNQKDYLNKNTLAYLTQVDSLHNAIKIKMEEIPQEQRVLITAHDAFGYFGTAYNIEVKGLQGISTMSDYGLKDISDLVNFIIERKIKAIFVETSVSERSINAVIEGCSEKGHPVKNGGSLYSDAMGANGTFEGTYIGMVSSNVDKIVKALK